MLTILTLNFSKTLDMLVLELLLEMYLATFMSFKTSKKATYRFMQEELPSPQDEEEAVDEDKRYHFMSVLLNLVNTFLCMVNTYIIVPTADDYSMSLGAAATVCGVVIGAMDVASHSVSEI